MGSLPNASPVIVSGRRRTDYCYSHTVTLNSEVEQNHSQVTHDSAKTAPGDERKGVRKERKDQVDQEVTQQALVMHSAAGTGV